MLGVILGIIFLVLVITIIFILAFVFWIWMIVDCAQRKFRNETDKVVWILVVIFLQLIGAIIYYFAVKRNRK
jgi:prolipoprotein diacylglyceryltransferase